MGENFNLSSITSGSLFNASSVNLSAGKLMVYNNVASINGVSTIIFHRLRDDQQCPINSLVGMGVQDVSATVKYLQLGSDGGTTAGTYYIPSATTLTIAAGGGVMSTASTAPSTINEPHCITSAGWSWTTRWAASTPAPAARR